MCAVSMIGDFYSDKWKPAPWYVPYTTPSPNQPFAFTLPPEITRTEFEALRKEVLDMKELLKRAKDYDVKNGEPDCEIDQKVALLKAVAKAVGVDLSEIFKAPV